MDFKAIETFYNGYHFRSRLEARWAVFFDAMGIEYQYEIEGYEIDMGEDELPLYYLPDFYLPQEKCFVEVKGTDEGLQADSKKIAFAVDYDATPCSEGLLILGDIPNPTQISWGNIPMFSYLYNSKCIVHRYAAFIPTFQGNQLYRGDKEIIGRLFSYDDFDCSECWSGIPKPTSTKCKWSKDALCSYAFDDPSKQIYKLTEAYKRARQARFEHGETPYTNTITYVNDVKYVNGIPF